MRTSFHIQNMLYFKGLRTCDCVMLCTWHVRDTIEMKYCRQFTDPWASAFRCSYGLWSNVGRGSNKKFAHFKSYQVLILAFLGYVISNIGGRNSVINRKSKLFLCVSTIKVVARGGAVSWGTALRAGRSRVWFPMVSLDFFHSHNTSPRTVALGSTQPLTEMSTRNVSWW
jgi:hypothetical protein